MRPRVDGDRLRQELMRRGINQGQFSVLSRVPPATLSRACTGHSVRASTLLKIANALATLPEVSAAVLLKDERLKR